MTCAHVLHIKAIIGQSKPNLEESEQPRMPVVPYFHKSTAVTHITGVWTQAVS